MVLIFVRHASGESPLRFRPLDHCLGAQVLGVDLRKSLTPDVVRDLYQLWLTHLVLLFREQDLSQADVVRIAGYFGAIHNGSRHRRTYRSSRFPKLTDSIRLISNIREDGIPIGDLPDGEVMFHHDMSHKALPNKATILYSIEVPRSGGNTVFSNGYSAYEELDYTIRDRLEGARAIHRYHYGSTLRVDSQSEADATEYAHPVFRIHDETGRKAVYVNRLKTSRLLGMAPGESERLLGLLFDHVESRRFIYSHSWGVGDLVLWDNRCVSHARLAFPLTERRLLFRVAIEGTTIPY